MTRLIGVVLLVDALLGPALVLLGWLTWRDMEQNISTQWHQFEQTTDDYPDPPDLAKVVVGTTATTPLDTSSHESLPPLRSDHSDGPGSKPAWSLSALFRDAQATLIQGLRTGWSDVGSHADRFKQLVSDKMTNGMGLLADTSVWKTVSTFKRVLVELVRFAKSISTLLLVYFLWRLTKVTQMIRAIYLIAKGEIPPALEGVLAN